MMKFEMMKVAVWHLKACIFGHRTFNYFYFQITLFQFFIDLPVLQKLYTNILLFLQKPCRYQPEKTAVSSCENTLPYQLTIICIVCFVVHYKFVINKIKTIRFCFIRIVDHILNCKRNFSNKINVLIGLSQSQRACGI